MAALRLLHVGEIAAGKRLSIFKHGNQPRCRWSLPVASSEAGRLHLRSVDVIESNQKRIELHVHNWKRHKCFIAQSRSIIDWSIESFIHYSFGKRDCVCLAGFRSNIVARSAQKRIGNKEEFSLHRKLLSRTAKSEALLSANNYQQSESFCCRSRRKASFERVLLLLSRCTCRLGNIISLLDFLLCKGNANNGTRAITD